MNKIVENILVKNKMVADSNLVQELEMLCNKFIKELNLEESTKKFLHDNNIDIEDIKFYTMHNLMDTLRVPLIETLSKKSLEELIQFCKVGILNINFCISNYMTLKEEIKDTIPAPESIIYVILDVPNSPMNMEKVRISLKFFFLLQNLFIKNKVNYNVIQVDDEQLSDNILQQTDKYIEDFINSNKEFMEQIKNDTEEDTIEAIEEYVDIDMKTNEMVNDFKKSMDDTLKEIFLHEDDEEDIEDD